MSRRKLSNEEQSARAAARYQPAIPVEHLGPQVGDPGCCDVAGLEAEIAYKRRTLARLEQDLATARARMTAEAN